MKCTDDFVNDFIHMVKKYQVHVFITKKQSSAFKNAMEHLKEDTLLVICDFAENYSFVVQDEVQSFHWNNGMVTLHPFVGYYLKDEVLHHVNFVCVSECNIHDTVMVHLFIKRFLAFVFESVPSIKKVMYFSDGCV